MTSQHESDGEGSISQVFQLLRGGDQGGVELLWQRFFPRLLGLAHKSLPSCCRTATGPEDVVQSAFISFWRQACNGDFEAWLNRQDIWNLLAVMVIRKSRSSARRARTQKRGGGRQTHQMAIPRNDDSGSELARDLLQWDAVEFDLHCEDYLLALDDETRAVVLLRLMGYGNREVAELLDCSERKIERKLQIARKTWELLSPSGSDEEKLRS